jgi:hypothetical protein
MRGLHAIATSFSLGLRVRTKSGRIIRDYAHGYAVMRPGNIITDGMTTPTVFLLELCCDAAKRPSNGPDMI